MKKHEKLLRQISALDRDRIMLAVRLIYTKNYQMLDIKKLSGFEEYRARVGRFRIKFIKHENHNEIIDIVRRDDNTY